MAQPIPLELPLRDPRRELRAKLESAPVEHAEAVLAMYEILQGLHDRGALELVRGALGSSDKVLEIIVEAAKSPESIRAFRNLLILGNTLAALDPVLLKGFAQAAPEALAQARIEAQNPPGLWTIFRNLRRKNVRRGLTMVNCLLEAIGRNLSS